MFDDFLERLYDTEQDENFFHALPGEALYVPVASQRLLVGPLAGHTAVNVSNYLAFGG